MNKDQGNNGKGNKYVRGRRQYKANSENVTGGNAERRRRRGPDSVSRFWRGRERNEKITVIETERKE